MVTTAANNKNGSCHYTAIVTTAANNSINVMATLATAPLAPLDAFLVELVELLPAHKQKDL